MTSFYAVLFFIFEHSEIRNNLIRDTATHSSQYLFPVSGTSPVSINAVDQVMRSGDKMAASATTPFNSHRDNLKNIISGSFIINSNGEDVDFRKSNAVDSFLYVSCVVGNVANGKLEYNFSPHNIENVIFDNVMNRCYIFFTIGVKKCVIILKSEKYSREYITRIINETRKVTVTPP